MDTRIDMSAADAPKRRVEPVPLLRFALLGLFVLAFVHGLYFAREFFMPVVLAFLLALTLTPVVRFLRRRGIPAVLSAQCFLQRCSF